MPIVRTSYLSVGILLITYEAEILEISCSDDFPPKITAIRFFCTINHAPAKFNTLLHISELNG